MSGTIRYSRLARAVSGVLLGGLIHAFPWAGWAAELPAETGVAASAVAETPASSSENNPDDSGVLPEVLDVLDTPRNYVSEKFVGFVSEVDRFFGGDRNFQETNQSVLQIEWLRLMEQGGNHKNVIAGRAKLTLPATERHLHLLLETDADRQASRGQSQTQGQTVLVDPNAATTPESYSAALRFEKEREDQGPWYFSTDAGISFQGIRLPQPFARAHASYAIPLMDWRFKAMETGFWFNTTGVGETTQLDFDRLLSETVLFRASTSATWLNDPQRFDVRQDFSGFHTLENKRAVLYQASVVGTSQPQWQTSDYVLLMMYRQKIHRSWIYFDVSPQLHFPRANGYRTTPQLLLRLEMLLDESK